MAYSYQQSPGVETVEIDNSLIVSGLNSNAAAFVGLFNWGPVLYPTTVTGEDVLVQTFGKPVKNKNQIDFFSAANFLRYSNNLLVTRIDAAGQYNATPRYRTLLTGTIALDNGSSAVVGTGTLFTTELAVGDKLIASDNSVIGTVLSITDATNLTLVDAYTLNALTTATIYKDDRVIIKNIDDYTDNFSNGATTQLGQFAAKYPGELGNSLKVIVLDNSSYQRFTGPGTITTLTTSKDITLAGVTDTSALKPGYLLEVLDNGEYVTVGIIDKVNSTTSVTLTTKPSKAYTTSAYKVSVDPEYIGLFTAKPETSDYAKSKGYLNAKDEVHIIIVDEDGKFTGEAGAILEKYAFKSKMVDAFENGESIYYKNVINNNSKYVYWLDSVDADVVGVSGIDWDTTLTTAADKTASTKQLLFPLQISLDGGSDFTSYTLQTDADSDKIVALQLLRNKESYACNSIFLGKASANVAIEAIAIAEKRKDCVVFISPEHTDGTPISGSGTVAVNKTLAYRDSLPSTSYAFLDSGYKQQLDYYNSVYINVPLNPDCAGLNATVANPWDSIGGFNKGQLKNTNKLLFNTTKEDRDLLYPKGVNAVVSFKGQGTILYGDKTLLSKPSAFDRIGTRNLFIFLEKSIERTAQYQLFEFNDAFTRSQFKNLVDPFLRDIKSRRGIFDFKTICDETNNTPNVVETNNFVADILIKPQYSINFITLNFTATRQSASFSVSGG